jgi:selenium metabolism protein YedF
MSPTSKIVDVRGLPCPQPVILARQALAEGGFETYEIIVDNEASKENLLKFAAYSKCAVERVAANGTETRILLKPGEGPAVLPETREDFTCESASRPVVLITSDGIGRGDDELARLLMRGFLYTLAASDDPPRRIILMNGGVRLAVEGSESLENLRRLAERGVEVLACGTCLEFFKLTDRLAVGSITNMYEITEHVLKGPVLSV